MMEADNAVMVARSRLLAVDRELEDCERIEADEAEAKTKILAKFSDGDFVVVARRLIKRSYPVDIWPLRCFAMSYGGEARSRDGGASRLAAASRRCEDRAVRVPPEIQGEWSSLLRTDDPEINRRSIETIREWLDAAAEALASGRLDAPSKDPKMYGHATSNVGGVTHPDFDGVEMATLRYWLKWWTSPDRSAYGREEAGRDPRVEAERVRREIEARERR